MNHGKMMGLYDQPMPICLATSIHGLLSDSLKLLSNVIYCWKVLGKCS